MKRLLKNYRLPENIEVLFLLIIGIILQMTDGSPFTIKKRWTQVWDTELPSEYFNHFKEHIIKTILAGIVVARCLTTYVYVVSAMLVIYCILKDTAPKLILIWLAISGLKSVCMTFVEALIGVYVCSAFGKIRKACVEFLLSKALEITLATYLWGSVLNMYYDMIRRREEEFKFENWDEYFKQMCFKRQRARSLLDESVLSKTAYLNNFEFKDVPQIMLQMLRREEDMSQDSLLGPGMMLASVSHMGSFDNIKKAQSLGELGTLDMRSVRIMGMDDDNSTTPTQKALKFLKLTWSDVRIAKERKDEDKRNKDYKDLFTIDDKTWEGVINNPGRIQQPRKKGVSIVVQEIPDADLDEETELKREKFSKIELELKFGFSLFNFLKEKNDDYFKEKEDEDEDEEEEEEVLGESIEEKSSRFFMSNIREEVAVNRIRFEFVSKSIKGNNYAKLYKEDYMNTIGHEVFDRASKLPKVTSLSQVFKRFGKKGSNNLQVSSDAGSRKRKKTNFEEEETAISSLSWSTLEAAREGELKCVEVNSNSIDSFLDTGSRQENEEEKYIMKVDSMFAEQKIQIKRSRDKEMAATKIKDSYNTIKSPEKIERLQNYENDDLCEVGEHQKVGEKKITYPEKRKIRIRKIGVKTEEPLNMKSEILDDASGDDGYVSPAPPSSFVKKILSPQEAKAVKSSSSVNNRNSSSAIDFFGDKETFSNSRQSCYGSKVFTEDSRSSCSDLKEKLSRENSENCLMENFENRPDKNKPGNRVWKSRVLKTALIYRKKTGKGSKRFRSNQNIDSYYFVERFLDKPYFYLMLNYLRKTQKNDELKKIVSGWYSKKKLRSVPHDLIKNNFGHYSYEHSRSYISSGSSYMALGLSKSSYASFLSIGDDDSAGETKCKSSTLNILRWVDIVNPNGHSENKTSTDTETTKLTNSDMKIPDDEDEFLNTPNTNKKVNFTVKSKYSCNVEGKDEDNGNVVGADSDECFSLFYSKAADLASPLLDMKRFIYPDHIHYSYKHVKKKGFDVDISGGLPLLVRESLTSSLPLHVKNLSNSRNLEVEITRRPMDLSFATTGKFAELQYNDPDLPVEEELPILKDNENSKQILKKSESGCSRKGKRTKKSKEKDEGSFFAGNHANRKLRGGFKKINSLRHNFLLGKLLRLYTKSHRERETRQISSTQLHSNRGRTVLTYNPAVYISEQKTRAEKRKVDSQEERTTDMMFRLEKEPLKQNKNFKNMFDV